MRPHSPNAKSKASGLARARMIEKAKLWWLHGYPIDSSRNQEWSVVPYRGERGPETISLTRTHLRQATYAATKLRNEYPRALPQLVGHADKWFHSLQELFALLKPWVHQGRALQPNLFQLPAAYTPNIRKQARRILLAAPSLEPLVCALSWTLFTRGSNAGKGLGWLEGHIDEAAAIMRNLPASENVKLLVQMAHLSMSVGEKHVAVLSSVFSDDRLYRTPLLVDASFVDQQDSYLRKDITRTRKPPKRPKANLSAELCRWVVWLVSQGEQTQRRALSLFECCDPRPILNQWAEWWPGFDRIVEKGQNIWISHDDPKSKRARLEGCRSVLAEIKECIPKGFDCHAYISMLQGFPLPSEQECFKPAYLILRNLPEELPQGACVKLAMHWHLLRDDENTPRRLKILIDAFSRYAVRTKGDFFALKPWLEESAESAAMGHAAYGIDSPMLDIEKKPTWISRCFETVACIYEVHPKSLSEDVIDLVADFLEIGTTTELAAQLVGRLIEAEMTHGYFPHDTLDAAIRLSDPEYKTFAKIVGVLKSRGLDDEENLKVVVGSICDAFEGQAEDLRRLLFGGQAELFIRCARKASLLAALKQPISKCKPVTKNTRIRDWMRVYPAPLHGALKHLARYHPDPEGHVQRGLRNVYRDRAALLNEQKAIQKRILTNSGRPRKNLERRMANIKKRLSNPLKIAPAKLIKVDEKIKRMAAQYRIEALEEQLDELLPDATKKYLGLRSHPDWLMQTETQRVIQDLPSLDKPMRELARKLLRIREGSGPWDLRDDPANQAFLETHRLRGVDVGPWVDGMDPVCRSSSGGGIISLALEDDPLEIFQMGSHFQTCLSPGDCNFFSAVSNAADINKRVLYGRDEDGKVVGRCLLALTSEGYLVVFHTYTHHKEKFCEEWVMDFARKLATRMGIGVRPRGHVPTLVSQEWYDDGTVDVAMQFAFLEKGSEFREILREAPLGQVLRLAGSAMGDVAWDSVTVPLILNLRECNARPEIILALLPKVQETLHLPNETYMLVATLMSRAGVEAQAAAFLAPRFQEMLRRQQRETGWMDPEMLFFLARSTPGNTLRLLRETRERGVRAWKDERDDTRVLAAAYSMEALKRNKRALDLYRMLGDGRRESHLRCEARKAISRLKGKGSR